MSDALNQRFGAGDLAQINLDVARAEAQRIYGDGEIPAEYQAHLNTLAARVDWSAPRAARCTDCGAAVESIEVAAIPAAIREALLIEGEDPALCPACRQALFTALGLPRVEFFRMLGGPAHVLGAAERADAVALPSNADERQEMLRQRREWPHRIAQAVERERIDRARAGHVLVIAAGAFRAGDPLTFAHEESVGGRRYRRANRGEPVDGVAVAPSSGVGDPVWIIPRKRFAHSRDTGTIGVEG